MGHVATLVSESRVFFPKKYFVSMVSISEYLLLISVTSMFSSEPFDRFVLYSIYV